MKINFNFHPLKLIFFMKMSLFNFQVFGSKWGKNIDQIALLSLAKHFFIARLTQKRKPFFHKFWLRHLIINKQSVVLLL